ncbi:MAG: MATE family efflux transporter [Lachnospiraceae bacterium]
MKKDRSAYLFSNKALVALIVPLIIEQLLAVCVGMADSIMIASVSEAAVSGVSLVDNIMVLLINVFGALATGGAVVVGQYLGQKKEKEACVSSTQLVWFITICSIGITIILYLAKNFILRGVFGHIDADVRGYANVYLLIVTASIPFIALYNGGAAVFRAMGNSKVPMLVSVVMNIINVAGNAIFIYGFHRGAEGVAIPTLVSRMVAAVLIIVLLCNQSMQVHIQKSFRYRMNGKIIRKILHIGIPNGLESSMFQLGKILVLSLVSTFGTYAIAANAVSNAVAMFQILPGMAISLAITTVIARCVGADDYEQVHYYTKKLIGITYVCMCTTVALIYLALPAIMRIYHLSNHTAAVTEQILIFHGICAIFIWPLSFSLPNIFRAAGDVRFSMYTSIFSMWVFRIAFSYILGRYFGLGVFGIWVAMVIDWCFRSMLFVYRYFKGNWH